MSSSQVSSTLSVASSTLRMWVFSWSVCVGVYVGLCVSVCCSLPIQATLAKLLLWFWKTNHLARFACWQASGEGTTPCQTILCPSTVSSINWQPLWWTRRSHQWLSLGRAGRADGREWGGVGRGGRAGQLLMASFIFISAKQTKLRPKRKRGQRIHCQFAVGWRGEKRQGETGAINAPNTPPDRPWAVSAMLHIQNTFTACASLPLSLFLSCSLSWGTPTVPGLTGDGGAAGVATVTILSLLLFGN